MKALNNQRNSYIDMLRVLFCIFVCLFHWGGEHFRGGYLGVDFFFVLSGFFLIKEVERKRDILAQGNVYTNCRSYLWKRICRFYPHFALMFLVLLILKVFVLGINSFHNFLLKAFWEVTFMQNIGLTPTSQILNGSTWYLSAVLIVSYLIYYLLQKNYDLYLHILAPLSIVFTFCYFNQRFGHIDVASPIVVVTTTGIIRGFAEMSLGCLCFKVVAHLEQIQIVKTLPFRAFQSVMEICMLGLITLMCYRSGHTSKDFVLVVFCAVLIISASLGGSLLSQICATSFVNPICQELGKLSFVMFLNHEVARCLLKYAWGLNGEPILLSLLFIGLTIVYSLMADRFLQWVSLHIKK